MNLRVAEPLSVVALASTTMTKLLLALTALLAGSASAFSCSSAAVVPLGSGCLGSRSVCAGAALAAKELRVQPEAIVMAVPKKRQSKMKTRQRKANWFAKARRQGQLALSRARSLKYDPLEDPKYSFDEPEGDEGEEDEEDDDEE